jgi:RNA polymerase sigma-70 factor (ECF subfamily)
MDVETSGSLELLLQRALTEGNDAKGKLLERYRAYLMLLARLQIGRRLQGKADSADLVQETFVRAHRDFASFRGRTPEALTAWLRQILAARLGDLVRRYCGTQRRNVKLEQALAIELDQPSQMLEKGLVDPLASPSNQAARREQAIVLAEALEQLPPDYREVLILHHLEDHDFSEVAHRMGRSVDAVKKLWARALGRMRRLLKGLP